MVSDMTLGFLKIHMLPTTKVLADAGYRGMQKFHKNVILPHRRSRKCRLSKDKKAENKELSSHS